MDKEFWTRNDHEKEKELTEICKRINETGEYLSCREIAEKLGTTVLAVKSRKSTLKLLTRDVYLKHFQKPKEPKKSMVPGIILMPEEEIIIGWLKKESLSIGDISRRLNEPKGVSKEYVYQLLDGLRKKGFDVEVQEDIKQAVLHRLPKRQEKPVDLKPLYRNYIKLGVIGDTHLTSIHQQLTLLHTAYDLAEKEGVDAILHTGDLTDGFRHYIIPECDSFTKGLDELVNYTVEHYPKSQKFKTKIIGGRHDLSTKWAFGFDLLRHICEKREDLSYVGDTMGTFHVKNINIRLYHPSGGSPFTRSYRAQRITEGMIGNMIQIIRSSGDLSSLPQLVFFGHLHLAFFFPYMGSLVFSVPALQAQTSYLEGKGLYPDIGMWIVTIHFDEKGNALKIIPELHLWNSLVKDHDY